jgi:integrase
LEESTIRCAVFCGIDWAEDHHDIALVGAHGAVLARLRIADNGTGLAQLHRKTKTAASEATLPIPDLCVNALRIRKDQQTQAQAAMGTVWRGSALVFTTAYGTPIEPRNFNRSWDARIAKSGIRKITVHDARRTCGSMLADLDVHPRVAIAILRHARFSITMEIYTQASTKATREALKRLGESLDG